MSTHTINGFIVWEKWKDSPKETGVIKFQSYKPTGTGDIWDTVLVREHSFDVEVADDFDPTAGLISSLEAEKKKLRLELAKKLMLIDEQISKLQCLTNEVPA